MLEERGRGAVLVGVARVDTALEHLLEAVMAQAPARGDGLFLPDRPLGSIGAKVALARRLGLIDAPVERALSARGIAWRRLLEVLMQSTPEARQPNGHNPRLGRGNSGPPHPAGLIPPPPAPAAAPADAQPGPPPGHGA
jgi:hypothetical protein